MGKYHAVDWDTCLPGSSALTTALARAGQAELALLAGDHFAACLWDMTKFFDMMDLPTLVLAAERHDFPIDMLNIALDMHTAPRRLIRQKTVGPAIQPGRSVLAGCGLATPFVRMYLRTDMSALIEDLQILHW